MLRGALVSWAPCNDVRCGIQLAGDTMMSLPVSEVIRSGPAMCSKLDMEGKEGFPTSSPGGEGGDCGAR